MITLEAFEQQLEIQKMYRDDKFASLLKEAKDAVKAAKEARRALDEQEKSLKERERLCDVIQGSQDTFNIQKADAEAKNLADQQHNQQTKDQILADRKAVDADLAAAKETKELAETELRKATTARKSAETKDRKVEKALEEAEAAQAKWENRLIEIGLKPAA
ncbi:MAG: hypothetical protein ACR2RF_10415 [Geminicoccaceae bacterium]